MPSRPSMRRLRSSADKAVVMRAIGSRSWDRSANASVRPEGLRETVRAGLSQPCERSDQSASKRQSRNEARATRKTCCCSSRLICAAWSSMDSQAALMISALGDASVMFTCGPLGRGWTTAQGAGVERGVSPLSVQAGCNALQLRVSCSTCSSAR